MGKNLEDLFNLCDRKFKMPTVLNILDQMLFRYDFFLLLKNFLFENKIFLHDKRYNIIIIKDIIFA